MCTPKNSLEQALLRQAALNSTAIRPPVRLSVCSVTLAQKRRISRLQSVVKMSWHTTERRSCTSDYWQNDSVPAPGVRKMHRNGTRNARGTVVCDQVTTSAQNNRRQLLVAGKYGIEYSLASASDRPCPHGWGPMPKLRGPARWKWSSLTSYFPL